MSTQQDIYAAGSENRPPMLNKENYVPWSSCLLRYAKSRPNGKLIYSSIINGPYVKCMIPKPGDAVPIPEMFYEQTDDELIEAEIKQMEADDQAIQTILLGLPEEIYATVDSCETAQEIWLRVQQLMKGSDIGIQEKKAKLFNEWEMFTSTDGESIESYYHRFSKLMNDFKRNKHFPEKIVTDYTQLYDFLKYNQKEVDDLRAERLAKIQDPLALMANSNNPFNYPVFHLDLPSSRNQGVQNAVQNPGVQNVRNQNGLIVVLGIANQNGNGNVVAVRAEGNANRNNGNQIRCYNCRGLGHLARNCTVRPRRRDVAYLQTQLLIAQKEEAGIQLQAEEFDLMVVATDLDEIETRWGTIEQHYANVEGTSAYHESLFHNLAAEVEKVNSVNHKMKEINAELTTELGRYKNQENCFEISQEKYDKLERCYQKSVYQEQCLTKKINALHLSSGKQITALNEEISNLNNQLSKEKSTISSLQEEKKRLKSNFKIREDELLDKQIQLENKIKDLDNILVKTGQSIQTMHMLSPKPDSFYHTKQKMALGYQNPFNLKQAQQKQQSLYNDKVLLGKHDPPAVYDSEETLELAQERKPTSFGSKLYFVTPFLKSSVLPKVDKTNALSKPVTSNSAPSTRESKGVQIVNVIAPEIFRTNPSKTSRVNFKTNGFSPKDVKSTTRTRRPQPRNNPKNDKVPSKSKSSWLSNNLEKIEENHRNLQSSSNQKHMSSECNNIKLAIRNAKSEVVCAMYYYSEDQYVISIKKIWRIRACIHQRPQKIKDQYVIWDNEDVHDLGSVETEFPAIVFNDTLTSAVALSYEPTVSSLYDEIDFRISFDEFNDEDCTPTVSYFDDLYYFKDFEKEFPAIVYNDAHTSKLDFLTEPTLSPQHIDEFNLKDDSSLSECDEEEQNILNFNDLFRFKVIYPDELKTDTDNDNDKVDIEHSSGNFSVKPLPDVINTDVGAYAHVSNKLLETSHDTSNKFFKTETFIKELNFNIMTWKYLNKGMSFIFLIKNLYVPFGIPFNPKLFYKDGI
ncbi:copia protein [Tanacetum coccineum]